MTAALDDDTFWSDSMDLRQFSDERVPGALTLPGPWVSTFLDALRSWGCQVIDQRVAVQGTARLHPQWELTLVAGVTPGLTAKIEGLLAQRGVRFTRHITADDKDMVDVRWEMANVCVWKDPR